MDSTEGRSGGATRALIAGPLLLLGAVAAAVVSDRLVRSGSLDGAHAAWAVAVPMALLAPGALGLAWRKPAGRGPGRLVLALTSGAIALLVAGLLVATVTWVGCRPVAGPMDVVPGAVFMGVVAGLAFAAATLLAARSAARGHLLTPFFVGALASVAGYMAALFALLVFAFPIAFCA